MKKIDKILDMFNELLITNVSPEKAVFVVANSFYSSKDEKINRDTLLRYMKSQIDIELFYKALEKRDLSLLNPERYSKDNNSHVMQKKNYETLEEYKENKNFSEDIDISPADLINEINSLSEKIEIFTKKLAGEKKVLDISKKLLSLSENNVKRATFRVEENLLEELEKFCVKHKEYKKTAVINFMIQEFLENYNK